MVIRKIRKIGNSTGVTGLPGSLRPGDLVIFKEGHSSVIIQKIRVVPDE